MQAGATFVGNFVLPAKSASSQAYITIRSSAPDSSLPSGTTRMTPAYAAKLPKLRSPNSMGVITTAAGAHHYRLMFLELLANAKGAGDIVSLGNGSAEQNTLGSVPHHLILELAFNLMEETVAYRWRADEREFAMPIRVGVPGKWQTIEATTDWKVMKSDVPQEKFQVATEWYYVNVVKSR